MTYIYGLVDPRTSELRYVGKSDDPETRLVQHYAESHNRHLRRWLDLLRSKSLRPRIMILDRVPDIGWEKYERAWIAAMKQSVGHRLANVHPGGMGGETMLGKKHTPETRAKMRAVALANRENRARAGRSRIDRHTWSLGMVGLFKPETIAKMSAKAQARPRNDVGQFIARKGGDANDS